MTRTIILDAAEPIACPKCAHAFPLSEGISRQTIVLTDMANPARA